MFINNFEIYVLRDGGESVLINEVSEVTHNILAPLKM